MRPSYHHQQPTCSNFELYDRKVFLTEGQYNYGVCPPPTKYSTLSGPSGRAFQELNIVEPFVRTHPDMSFPPSHHRSMQSLQSQNLSRGALFVGDLSFFTSEADLRRLFAPFGKLKRAEVKRGRFGDSLMHGFVELDQLSSAQVAMRELDSSKFMGRRIRVHWAYSNAEKSSPRDRESWTQLHVTFSSQRIDFLVTEEVLDRLFSRFGEVADVTVKKHSRTIDPPFQSGYAFVYFYMPDPAIVASEELKNIVLSDVHFESALSFRSQRVVESLAAYEATKKMIVPDDFSFRSEYYTKSNDKISFGSSTLNKPKHVGGDLLPTHGISDEDASLFSFTSQQTSTFPAFDRLSLLQSSQQSSDSSISLYPSGSTCSMSPKRILSSLNSSEEYQSSPDDFELLKKIEPATPTTAVVSSSTYAVLND